MALPVWPSGLDHRPVVEPFELSSPYPDAVTTEFEDGPPRMRRQSFTGIRKLSYAIKTDTAAQFQQWDAFVTGTLSSGISHFTMPVYLPGRGCVTRRCYLDGGKWAAKPHGAGSWLVSFNLCVFPS